MVQDREINHRNTYVIRWREGVNLQNVITLLKAKSGFYDVQVIKIALLFT